MSTKYNSKSTRLTDQVIRDIWNGRFDETGFPCEEALCREYKSSRNTIRRVINKLVADGVLTKEVNHSPSINASLAREQTTCQGREKPAGLVIGLVWASFPDAMTTGICNGVRRFVSEQSMSYLLFQELNDNRRMIENLKHIDSLGVDGILTFGAATPDYVEPLMRLKERKFPVVLLDRPIPELDLPCVHTDLMGGEYQASSRLLAKMKKPVCFFGPRYQTENLNHKFIYDGYQRAMIDAGYFNQIENHSYFTREYDGAEAFYPGERKLEPLLQTARQLLESESLPVGIICNDDYFAQTVYAVAEEKGLVIGKDVLVWGISDLPFAANNPVCPLSTIRQPHEEVGYEAARMLIQIIRKELSVPLQKMLPVELAERQSTDFHN